MEDADIEGLSTSIDASLDDIRRIVDRERWDGILTSIEVIMDKADSSLGNLDDSFAGLKGITEGNAKTIEEAIEEFKKAMEQANIFLEKGASLVSGTDDSISHLSRSLETIIRNLEQASENLNRITEIVADQPSQLIFGDPPVPREVDE
jgi:ABC-type transporter Mla subunit MlaD